MKTPTNNLTHAIIAYLSLSGFRVWRNGNHAVYSVKRRAFLKNPTKLLGIPDIIGYQKKTGRAIYIEVKTGKDKLSTEQLDFLNDATDNKCIALIAWDFDNFEKQIKQYL